MKKQISLTTFYRQCYYTIVRQRTDPKIIGIKQVVLRHARSIFEKLKKN